MKLISLLITLLIIGFLVMKQLDQSALNNRVEDAVDSETSTVKVPTAPQDIPKFEKDMNAFLEESAKKRAKEYE